MAKTAKAKRMDPSPDSPSPKSLMARLAALQEEFAQQAQQQQTPPVEPQPQADVTPQQS